MDQQTRNLLQNATQRARRLLEAEIAEQLAGTFDILQDGTVAAKPGPHLTLDQVLIRGRLVESVRHRAGRSAQQEKLAEAVGGCIREMAFTVLNRFVALKMLEARSLVQQCISRGDQSSGFREFTLLAPGLATFADKGYRLYLECVFDELSVEVKILFDRHDPASLIWPRRQALDDLLSILNDAELADVWSADETIGWVYQYFNSQEERRAMRDASQAPRNSRELAVRNQFFTPRYVVQFLTDNSLGRTWYEMRKGQTRLTKDCKYMFRRPTEIFLAEGQPTPEESMDQPDLQQEALLKQPVHIRHRPKKDPRDLKILDPASGSGHFLLYCFDLLLTIYDEAWNDPGSPPSQITGKTLREDYDTEAALKESIPGLILRYNLHGIDIDPRCAQIAALALWMRAQRAFAEFKISRDVRPAIRKTNIVVAEPMPGESDLLDEFCATLNQPLLGQLLRYVFEKMVLAGEMGYLLKLNDLLRDAISEARQRWIKAQTGSGTDQHLLFGGVERRRGADQLHFNFTGITNESFWRGVEPGFRAALSVYSDQATLGERWRRRLFADDAAAGLGLIDLSLQQYDIILMNPPFGLVPQHAAAAADISFPTAAREIALAFVEEALAHVTTTGMVGVISTRTPFFIRSYGDWRELVLSKGKFINVCVDLGRGVLDATVGAVAYVAAPSSPTGRGIFVRGFKDGLVRDDIAERLLETVFLNTTACLPSYYPDTSRFSLLPNHPFPYWVDARLLDAYARLPQFESDGRRASSGATTNDDFRFLRLWVEVASESIAIDGKETLQGKRWVAISKGGEYAPYYRDVELVVNWAGDGQELKSYIADYRGKKGWGFLWSAALNGYKDYFRPGITWSRRTSTWISGRALPNGCIFGDKGPAAFAPTDDAKDLLYIMAWLNSSATSGLLALSVGKEGATGTAESCSYEVGIVEHLPFPATPLLKQEILALALSLHDLRRNLAGRNELYRWFSGHPIMEIANAEEQQLDIRKAVKAAFDDQRRLDILVGKEFGLTEALTRELEAGSRIQTLNPDEPFEELFHDAVISDAQIKSWVLGCVLGRWDVNAFVTDRVVDPIIGPFDALPARSPAMSSGVTSDHASRGTRELTDQILTDDPSHHADISARFIEVVRVLCGQEDDRSDRVQGEGAARLQSLSLVQVRKWLCDEAFADHLSRYSKSRRRAPVYWQLATISSSYSVWLYAHRASGDTLFRVQKLVEEKLEHEHRNFSGLKQSAGANSTASQRKELEAVEVFVVELATMLDEVKRVAPLWKPDLDDGVVLVLAPLWRLFPQHRAWQTELKSRWDGLCEGMYDWAHVAMHLWPERVVLKCQNDHSLAIAHGLAEIFWEDTQTAADANPQTEAEDEGETGEDADMYGDQEQPQPRKRAKRAGGKQRWVPKAVDAKQVEQLIAERTKPTVKAALKNLLEGPTPGGKAIRNISANSGLRKKKSTSNRNAS